MYIMYYTWTKLYYDITFLGDQNIYHVTMMSQ